MKIDIVLILIVYGYLLPDERIEKMKEINEDEITSVTRGKEIFYYKYCDKIFLFLV